jgi:hypothetical protein
LQRELQIIKYQTGTATYLKRESPVQYNKGRTLSKTMYQEVGSTYLKRRTWYKECEEKPKHSQDENYHFPWLVILVVTLHEMLYK